MKKIHYKILLLIIISFSCTIPVKALDYNNYTIPSYDGDSYEIINGNNPIFSTDLKSKTSYENYSNLDSYQRSGPATAMLSESTISTTERGDISQITPSGWHSITYDIIPGKYLYNRCHLVGYQLAGNNNKNNFFTCTRQLNNDVMLQYENKIKTYIENTNNHVLYRVTPIFQNTNLLANGVLMEATSLEDNGQGIKFCIFGYNVQPGITINYSTGESKLSSAPKKTITTATLSKIIYTYNGKYQKPSPTVKSSSTILKKGTDYTLTYKNNLISGKAKITITGINNYKGTIAKYFYIKPSKAIVLKTKTSSHYIKYTWKRNKGATGYQIAFRKMGPNKYKYYKTTYTSKTFKTLKSKKYHQFKVRAYKTIDGKRYYGEWSKVIKKRTY